MNKSLNWYDLRYLKTIVSACAFCGGLVAVPLFVVALLYGRPAPWCWWFFVPAAAAVGCLRWLFLYGIRERAVLKAQLAAGLAFPDLPLTELVRRTLYASDSWLILAGKLAVHRSFLERVTIEITDKGVHWGPTYWTVFQLKNGKRYRIHVDASSTAGKIKNWCGQEG